MLEEQIETEIKKNNNYLLEKLGVYKEENERLKELIQNIKKGLPHRSRLDAGLDFNLHQIHSLIDTYTKENERDNNKREY